MSELRVCRNHGISHSHFLGGKMRWTQVDREKAIALERYESRRCTKCGSAESDWWDADRGLPLEEPLLEVMTHTCYGCVEIERAQEQLEKHGRGRGRSVVLVPFDQGPQLEFDDLPAEA